MALFGLFGKKKKAPTFEYQPYGGMRPPRIGDDILRGVQKQDYDLAMRQSLGQDVGFDPARRTAAQALLESKLGKQREDDIRSAQGRVAASGLSGNLRAQEALTGRVDRDYGRTLGEQTNVLNIEDLTRASDERQSAIDRLANLNRFNFGQEDTAANFDLDVYGAEQGNRRAAADSAFKGYSYDRGQDDEFVNSLLRAGGTVVGALTGGPAGAMAGNSAAQALTGGGKGIAPQYGLDTPSFYNQPLRKTGAYRYLMR